MKEEGEGGGGVEWKERKYKDEQAGAKKPEKPKKAGLRWHSVNKKTNFACALNIRTTPK
jgi:hypothetical protein